MIEILGEAAVEVAASVLSGALLRSAAAAAVDWIGPKLTDLVDQAIALMGLGGAVH